jgi:ABC-type proline/glycine betaine transport system permease subunit
VFRSPSRIMRIFSSAEYWRRVALRMSLTVFSALPDLAVLALIVASVGVTMSPNLSLMQSAQSVR